MEKSFLREGSSIPSPMFEGALFEGFVGPIQRSDHLGKPNGGQPQKDRMSNLFRRDTDGQGSSGMRFDRPFRFRTNGDPKLDEPSRLFIQGSGGVSFLSKTIIFPF